MAQSSAGAPRPSHPWLARRPRRSPPAARIFCFPNAGVGASAFRLWHGEVPDDIEVCVVQLPGRESRLREPPIVSIPELAAKIMPVVRLFSDLPFAFFGHSMGALVASEVTRSLEASGASMPRLLVVSSRRPPHLPGLETPISHLPDDDFVAAIQSRYGGIPPEILAEPDIMQVVLPGLRADFVALETHRPEPRPPVSCPISALGGRNDRLTPAEHLEAWREETRAAFRMRLFDGGHFYLFEQRQHVLSEVISAFE